MFLISISLYLLSIMPFENMALNRSLKLKYYNKIYLPQQRKYKFMRKKLLSLNNECYVRVFLAIRIISDTL
jgi:hypothetical protein